METRALRELDLERLVSIARKNGATSVSLFGSFSRGQADSASDLDLLIEFEKGRTLLDLVRLERELESVLGMDVDVVTPSSLHPSIRDSVMEQRVQVL